MTTWTDGDRNRLILCSVTAMCLHAAGAAAIFLGFGRAAAPTAQPAALMVVELAALPSAPPMPPSLTPPEPERVKAVPRPMLLKLDIPPPPLLSVPIHPAVVVPVQKRSDFPPAPDKAPAQETTRAAAPDAPPADRARAPAIGAPSTSPSKAQQTWESRVLAALERKKRYPGEARRLGQQDSVYVSIRLDADGRLLTSTIRRSLGYAALNAEVASLVRRASPYPPPPADMLLGKTEVTLLVPVEFFLDKTHGRP